MFKHLAAVLRRRRTSPFLLQLCLSLALVLANAAAGRAQETAGDNVPVPAPTAAAPAKLTIDDVQSGLTKPVSEGLKKDLLSDSDGEISFHRFQIVVLTIIPGTIFCVGVYRALAMPEFDGKLLALMGVSSGTYLGFKIPERQS